MDFHGFSWICMDLDGFEWICMDLDENQRKSMKSTAVGGAAGAGPHCCDGYPGAASTIQQVQEKDISPF